MEQVVWTYFGVVVVIIAFGIIASISLTGSEQMKESSIYSAIDLLKERANFVCHSEIGTSISQKIRLGGGVFLSVDNIVGQESGKICIEYKDNIRCESINCPVPKKYDLNLDTPEIRELVHIREYNCLITRIQGGVEVECKG